MKKKLLQISNDFSDQKIYVNLIRNLSNYGYKQIVYVPVKWKDKINGNRDDSINGVVYHYSFILKRNLIFKLRYRRKLNIILKDIEDKINLNEVGLVHAHFLFSDGGVAYLLKKKFDIPFIVSVRASDIHTFFSKMIHLRKFGNEIMMAAERVIFINHSYKKIFLQNYLNKAYSDLANKFITIPNAIDDKWFNNEPLIKNLKNEVRILYVGRIIKRKKLDVVIKAIKELNKKQGENYILEVVGSGNYLSKVMGKADNNVIFHGHIKDYKALLELYKRCHIFAMPSVMETFGLVYIEAMSQRLPIIYCKNEGVDGFFKNNEVGVSVIPNSVDAVVDAINYIKKDYDNYSLRALNASKSFNWNEITNEFVQIYSEVLN